MGDLCVTCANEKAEDNFCHRCEVHEFQFHKPALTLHPMALDWLRHQKNIVNRWASPNGHRVPGEETDRIIDSIIAVLDTNR